MTRRRRFVGTGPFRWVQGRTPIGPNRAAALSRIVARQICAIEDDRERADACARMSVLLLEINPKFDVRRFRRACRLKED